MRLLLLHADSFSFAVTGETSITKQLDPIPPELSRGNADEVLVCMIAVEQGDGEAQDGIINDAASSIAGQCNKIGAKKVFLYPYAHLSSSLEKPRVASKMMDRLESALSKNSALQVHKAPFGVYKSFDIKVKGHPLSELARTITAEGREKKKGIDEDREKDKASLKAESNKISEWLIISPDGTATTPDKFNFDNAPALRSIFDYEIKGSRISEEPPPHIRLMQEHELVDYEPASDSGNFRWYPKGYVMKKALEEQVNTVLNKYGAMQVETPIMYSNTHPALAKYLEKFPARQYTVISDKAEFFLRFAACFGQYLIKHDMQISYKQLPVRLYELTHYSFRREQTGELAGIKRLRAFTMPDMHTLCANIPQGIEEMLNQVKLSFEWMDSVGFKKEEYAVAIRVVKSFYEENSDYIKKITEYYGRPILLEIWPEQYFYFVTKFEVNFIDSQGKASALCTVQIDVKNPQEFGISYVDKDSSRKTPILLHASISGSIDRNIYALLEQQAMQIRNGKIGHFPFWLSPTQIRIIPVSENHVGNAMDLAKKLKGRVDIDDRTETVGKRIRMTEREWIPLSIVLGDKELNSSVLPVRIRGQEKTANMSIEEINAYFDREMGDKIYRPINLPILVSNRPIFRS